MRRLGKPLDAAMRECVLEPLDMIDTHFYLVLHQRNSNLCAERLLLLS